MGTDAAFDDEVRIEELLGVVSRREDGSFEAPDNRTPLKDLLAKERREIGGVLIVETEEEWTIRAESMRRLLGFFFADGPHPGAVLRRVFAVAWAMDKTLVWNMTQQDMAIMFKETKAAMSWRILKIFTGYLKHAGMRGAKVPGQKSESARDAYAQRALGNKNRSGSGKDKKKKG